MKVYIKLLLAAAALLTAGCGKTADTTEANLQSQEQSSEAESQEAGLTFMLEKLPAVESVQLWENAFAEGGIVITTEHYAVHSTLKDFLLTRRIPLFLETLHSRFQEVSGISTVSRRPSDVYLFAEREQWELFTEGFTAEYWPYFKNIKNGAFYHNGVCAAYNLGLNKTLSLLAHECWHQFSRRHFRYQLPAWIDEGMAMSFEGVRFTDGGFDFNPKYNKLRIQGLSKAAADNYEISFTELLKINPTSLFKEPNPERTNAYYSKLYSFIRFLREYDKENYASKLFSLIQDGAEGKWDISRNILVNLEDRNVTLNTAVNRKAGVAVFEEYFGSNYEKMEKQYQTFSYSLITKGGKKSSAKGELDSPGLSRYNKGGRNTGNKSAGGSSNASGRFKSFGEKPGLGGFGSNKDTQPRL
ncbi:hypothetical protein [Sedimentisphaera salicampi]|uniref:hypothetical protein n=1 Tax=Sedimentisphaera salicampi TaxID=1941349 RepID=UPI000B9A3F16|nr:hypothetical protein [Sedimentisphaera salicampi]OXU14361.1 hypothetical protein SMSP1_01903 [Sedimentisphaera salicampi]